MKQISLMSKGFIFSFILLAVISFSVDSYATNGTQMIGYGSKSVGMGGADLAIANDATAINANPATLTGLKSEIDFDLTAFGPQVHHTDSASDTDGKNPYFYMPLLAYVSGGSPVSWGIGIFPQGGMGVDYRDKVKNQIGQTDSLYSNLSYMRIVPAVAYQINEQFSLGLGLQFGYTTFDMEYYKNLAMEFKNGSSSAYGLRIGALYKANEQVSIGAIYNTKQSFEYDGDIKFGSAYGSASGKAKFKDFSWPSELGVGISYKPFNELTLGLDISQLQWSDAVNKPYLAPRCPTKCIALKSPQPPFTKGGRGGIIEIDDKNCVKCMHCINVMHKALAPGKDRGVTILLGGKRTLKIGDTMSSVIVPFMKLETDEDYEKLANLVRRIWEFWGEHGMDHERVGEFIDRVGLGTFLEGIGLEPDPQMVKHPRTNPYIKFEELAPPRMAGEPKVTPNVMDKEIEGKEIVIG